MTDLDNQENLWDYYQNETPDYFTGALPRYKFLLKAIPAGAAALNIGVGSGRFEDLAQEKGVDIYALDPVPKSIETLQSRLGLGEKARSGYSQDIPFPDSTFDFVVASEVLEHLSPEITAATLKEIRRVLKPGGAFIGTVPARENLQEQIVVCPGCSLRFHRWGHQQSFSIESMRHLLSKELKPVQVEEKLFIAYSLLNFKGRIVGAVKYLLFKLGVMGSNQNVYFRAVK